MSAATDTLPCTGLLEGALNFRDVGPLPAGDGRRVRLRRLFRSEALHQLKDGDLDVLAEFGIRTIVDLRTAEERVRRPSRWPEGVPAESLHLDVNEAYEGSFADALRADPSADFIRRSVIDSYRRMPRRFAAHIGRLFDRLAEPAGLPVVIHCHAGKDRTGFAIALILEALGVERAAIDADYVLTTRFRPLEATLQAYGPWLEEALGRPADLDLIRPINRVEPAYLEAAFDEVARGWGSLEDYLAGPGRLDAAKRARLKDLLLE